MTISTFPSSQNSKDLLETLPEVFQPSSPIKFKNFFRGRYDLLQRCEAATLRKGSHIILYGNRGVGKTSLANIAMILHTYNSDGVPDENQRSFSVSCDSGDTYQSVWRKLFPGYLTKSITLRSNDDGDGEDDFIVQEIEVDFGTSEVLDTIKSIGGVSLLVLDEFDRLPSTFNKRLFADTIKAISDNLPNVTLMIVGVGDTVRELIGEHPSIERNLVQVFLPPMPDEELMEIVTKGMEQLGMTMEPGVANDIVRLSCGYPYYTHLLSYEACRNALLQDRREITTQDFNKAIIAAVDQSQESLRKAYQEATFSNKENILKEILWAIAKLECDEYGTFQASDLSVMLSEITGREMKTGKYLAALDQLCEEDRGSILKKIGRPGEYRYKIANPLMKPFLLLKNHSSQKSSG